MNLPDEFYDQSSALEDSNNNQTVPSSNGDRIKRKYLLFSLNEENYAVPLSCVKEVVALSEITKMPQAPAFFKGLINLRGKIHSVVDFKRKLDQGECRIIQKQTSIIIIEIEDLTIGFMVEDVKEVVSLSESQIESELQISSTVHEDYIQGVAKLQDKRLVILLSMNRILNFEELSLVRHKLA